MEKVNNMEENLNKNEEVNFENDCTFCKIAKGEISCHKIHENDDFIAFLDIFPNTKGMTVVSTKKHFNSDVLNMDQEEYNKFLLFARKVSHLLEKKLDVKRVALVIEGLGVNHAHIKLYPMHGLTNKFKSMQNPQRIFLEKYEGYVTTLMGEKANDEELKKLASKIRGDL
ncbi:MAG: HIT domain-containing protein [Nanoarchaeota archaeon]